MFLIKFSDMSNKSEPKNNPDSFSKRLKHLVDTMGVKQSHMAQKLGLSPSGIHYILNNDIKFSKNAQKIAEYLNVNPEWLSKGEGEIEKKSFAQGFNVPLYYPDQLKLAYCSQSKLAEPQAYHVTGADYVKPIAIYVTDNEFSPKFEPGDILVFEQRDRFESGDIVLCYLAKKSELVVKYGLLLDNKCFLYSPSAKPIDFDVNQGDVLLGVCKECLKKI